MIIPAIVFLIYPGIIAQLTRVSVARYSEGKDHLPAARTIAWAQLGAVPGVVLAWAGHDPVLSAITCALISTLALGAYCDRKTGWAPDIMMVAAGLLSALFGAASGAWGISIFQAAGIGIAVWIIVQACWIGIALVTPRASLIHPGDILVMIYPLLAMGVSFEFSATMLLVALLLLLCLVAPQILNIFSKDDIRHNSVSEIGIDAGEAIRVIYENKPAVTFLAVGFPVYAMALLASIV